MSSDRQKMEIGPKSDRPTVQRHAIRTGITLLELMCATVISSILLFGLTGISVSTIRGKARMDKLDKELTDQCSLVRLIEFDLMNSRELTFTRSRITFIGYATKNQAGRITQSPSVVTYEIQTVSGKQLLLRRQGGTKHPAANVFGRENSDSRTDIVGHEIRSLDILEFDRRIQNWRSLIWNNRQSKSIPVPGIVRIQAFKTNQTGPFLDEVFCINASFKS